MRETARDDTMADPTPTPTPQPEPEAFSPASAKLAAEELFESIPKTRRLDHIGALNEVLYTIERLTAAAKVDATKAVA